LQVKLYEGSYFLKPSGEIQIFHQGYIRISAKLIKDFASDKNGLVTGGYVGYFGSSSY